MICDDSPEAHKQSWALQHALNNLLFTRSAPLMLLLVAFLVRSASAQESPYIVTYDHYLEEPGNLEVEYFSILARNAVATTSTPTGLNLNTAPPRGGQPSFTSMGRRPSTTALSSLGFVGRTASFHSGASISSTRCSIWSTNRSAKPTRS